MTCSRRSLNRHVKGIVVIMTALLFSFLIVVESNSTDHITSQSQENQKSKTPLIVFKNMSSANKGV